MIFTRLANMLPGSTRRANRKAAKKADAVNARACSAFEAQLTLIHAVLLVRVLDRSFRARGRWPGWRGRRAVLGAVLAAEAAGVLHPGVV